MYSIEYAEGVVDDLATLRARDRKQVLDQLEKQLKYEPTKKTKNRKPLPAIRHKPPHKTTEEIL